MTPSIRSISTESFFNTQSLKLENISSLSPTTSSCNLIVSTNTYQQNKSNTPYSSQAVEETLSSLIYTSPPSVTSFSLSSTTQILQSSFRLGENRTTSVLFPSLLVVNETNFSQIPSINESPSTVWRSHSSVNQTNYPPLTYISESLSTLWSSYSTSSDGPVQMHNQSTFLTSVTQSMSSSVNFPSTSPEILTVFSSSSSIVIDVDYVYTHKVFVVVDAYCALLDDDEFKRQFFEQVNEKLEQSFTESTIVINDEGAECGSIKFNYTVETLETANVFQGKLDKSGNWSVSVNGTSFSIVSSTIVESLKRPITSLKSTSIVMQKSKTAITTTTTTTTTTITTTSRPKTTGPNDQNITVLYATIFSVTGFIVLVIIIVIVIGCRKSSLGNPIKHTFELDRFSTINLKGVEGMYGDEDETTRLPPGSEAKSPTNEELSPMWVIPKLEFDDAVDSNANSFKQLDDTSGGFVNLALDDEEN